MGAGKSTLVAVILENGIPVWDADKAVHALYETEGFVDEISSKLGIRTRAEAAALIVQDPSVLPILEKLAEEWLEADFQVFMSKHESAKFVIMDVPLLYEQGWDELCDSVIIVQCPRAIREERVMKRPGMTPEKMKLLMDKQLSDEERLDRGNFIVYTDSDIEDSRHIMTGILTHLQEFYA